MNQNDLNASSSAAHKLLSTSPTAKITQISDLFAARTSPTWACIPETNVFSTYIPYTGLTLNNNYPDTSCKVYTGSAQIVSALTVGNNFVGNSFGSIIPSTQIGTNNSVFQLISKSNDYSNLFTINVGTSAVSAYQNGFSLKQNGIGTTVIPVAYNNKIYSLSGTQHNACLTINSKTPATAFAFNNNDSNALTNFGTSLTLTNSIYQNPVIVATKNSAWYNVGPVVKEFVMPSTSYSFNTLTNIGDITGRTTKLSLNASWFTTELDPNRYSFPLNLFSSQKANIYSAFTDPDRITQTVIEPMFKTGDRVMNYLSRLKQNFNQEHFDMDYELQGYNVTINVFVTVNGDVSGKDAHIGDKKIYIQ